jgi:polyhydroxyalkanoate synthesis repressor PhaR
MARIIKRYSNRKLYDTQEKRYLTLAQVSVLVRRGEEIHIIDQDSGDDVTTLVLSKVVAANVGENQNHVPKNVLTELIRHPKEVMIDYVKKSVAAGFDTVSQVGVKLEKRIKDIIQPDDPAAASLSDDVLDTKLSALAPLIDARVQAALNRIDLARRRDIDSIKRQLKSIFNRLDSLAQSGGPRTGTHKKKRTK